MSDAVELTPLVLADHFLPALREGGDKHDRGRVLVVAGGAEVPGAALLCGVAALRSGAGVVQLAGASAWAMPLALGLPEARVIRVASSAEGDITAEAAEGVVALAAEVHSVVVGPGMLHEAAACAIADALVAAGGKARLVIDAGALGYAAKGDPANPPILTPHAGEAARMLDLEPAQIEADPPAAALRLAAERIAVVILKGATTHIATPDGHLWRHAGGVVGLGTGGSGDVLAGAIAALAARGADPLAAAMWGVAIHARAGAALSERIGRVGFLGREIAEALAPALEDASAR